MEEKTYIIEHENGIRRKITIPADWKVTFGPAARGEYTNKGNHLKMPMALRFYESETKQRAIFTDVLSFRDTAIKIEEEKSTTQEKEGYVECEGVRKKTFFQATVKEWVDPDNNDKTTVPLLPTDGEMFKVKEDLDF